MNRTERRISRSGRRALQVTERELTSDLACDRIADLAGTGSRSRWEPIGLVEAAGDGQLTKTINRYGRVDVLCIDQHGYMELDRRAAELPFQVLTEREERASVAIASNEPFSRAHMFAATCARQRLSLTGSAARLR